MGGKRAQSRRVAIRGVTTKQNHDNQGAGPDRPNTSGRQFNDPLHAPRFRAHNRATALTAPALTSLLFSHEAAAKIGDTLRIAYHVPIPAWDPTTGLSSVNPQLMSIYKCVFDQYVDQNPDLSFKGGILTEWGWTDDKTKIRLKVRDGAKWQDGKPVTAQDIIWNLQRVGNPKTGNPVSFVWASITNLKADGNVITGDVKAYQADLFKWMAFLTAYVIPPHYYQQVGKAGFEKKPMGSGPYTVAEFQRGSFVRLKANPNYWGAKPAFEQVVFKFVTDPAARVAEIESGRSDLTLNIPFEEFDRLKKKSGLVGVTTPVSDIAMIFFNDAGPMTDPNVRMAAVLAVNKEVIVKRLLRGYGVPIETLLAPEYVGFDPSVKTPYDPKKAMALLAKSGYSRKKPVRFKIQTTRGYLAQGLRSHPGDRRHVAQGRHPGRDRGLRGRQAFRVARPGQAGAGGVLQLGQLFGRSDQLYRTCHVRPVAPFGLGYRRPGQDDRCAVVRKGREKAHRGLAEGQSVHRRESVCAAALPASSAGRAQSGSRFQGSCCQLRPAQYDGPQGLRQRHGARDGCRVRDGQIGLYVTPAATMREGRSDDRRAWSRDAQKSRLNVRRLSSCAVLVLAVPTLFGVAVIVFVLLRDCAGRYHCHADRTGRDRGGYPESAQSLRPRQKHSSNSSCFTSGDSCKAIFGTSISLRQDVLELIVGRLPVTLELCLVAIVLAVGYGHGDGRGRRILSRPGWPKRRSMG